MRVTFIWFNRFEHQNIWWTYFLKWQYATFRWFYLLNIHIFICVTVSPVGSWHQGCKTAWKVAHVRHLDRIIQLQANDVTEAYKDVGILWHWYSCCSRLPVYVCIVFFDRKMLKRANTVDANSLTNGVSDRRWHTLSHLLLRGGWYRIKICV